MSSLVVDAYSPGRGHADTHSTSVVYGNVENSA